MHSKSCKKIEAPTLAAGGASQKPPSKATKAPVSKENKDGVPDTTPPMEWSYVGYEDEGLYDVWMDDGGSTPTTHTPTTTTTTTKAKSKGTSGGMGGGIGIDNTHTSNTTTNDDDKQ